MSKPKYTYDQALIAELMQVLRPVNVRRVRIVAQTLHEMEHEEAERLAARKEVIENEKKADEEEPSQADANP